MARLVHVPAGLREGGTLFRNEMSCVPRAGIQVKNRAGKQCIACGSCRDDTHGRVRPLCPLCREQLDGDVIDALAFWRIVDPPEEWGVFPARVAPRSSRAFRSSVAAALALFLVLGLAITNALPHRAQNIASAMLAKVGIDVAPDHFDAAPAPPAEEPVRAAPAPGGDSAPSGNPAPRGDSVRRDENAQRDGARATGASPSQSSSPSSLPGAPVTTAPPSVGTPKPEPTVPTSVPAAPGNPPDSAAPLFPALPTEPDELCKDTKRKTKEERTEHRCAKPDTPLPTNPPGNPGPVPPVELPGTQSPPGHGLPATSEEPVAPPPLP